MHNSGYLGRININDPTVKLTGIKKGEKFSLKLHAKTSIETKNKEKRHLIGQLKFKAKA